MKSYTKKYILSIVLIIIIAAILVSIAIFIKDQGHILPWALTAIYVCSFLSITHIIAGIIYTENNDKNSGLRLPNFTKFTVFMISLFSQIICTFSIFFEALKRFGNIHFIEYVVGGIFLFISAYFFKRATYILINKEKNDEQNETE